MLSLSLRGGEFKTKNVRGLESLETEAMETKLYGNLSKDFLSSANEHVFKKD